MREFDLIARFAELFPVRSSRVARSIGDDCAVVRTDGAVAVSTDAFVEGVHFRLATTSLPDLGHKCLAASLSDLAAMGAEAGEAYLTLGLPPNIGEREALELAGGADRLAAELGVTICGGDLTASNELFVTVTTVGHAPDPDTLVGRDGASPGDLIGVTGRLGGAGAGLILLEGKVHGVPVELGEALIERHRRPQPRLAAGRALAQAGVSAMLDVSDGIAPDALRLAEASALAVEIELERLPLDDGVADVARIAGVDAAELAATAGEDYELLFAAPASARAAVEAAGEEAGSPVTWVGVSREGAGVRVLDEGSVRPLQGWDHFARRSYGSHRRPEPA